MLTLRNRILSLIVDTIIQCRIDLKQAQLKRFNQLLKQVQSKNLNSFENSIDNLLEHILIKERYDIMSKLSADNLANESNICIKINFYLKKRNQEQHMVQAQSWEINIAKTQKQPAAVQNFNMLLYFFEELIIFLNQRPLFIKYQKNEDLRLKYSLKHKLFVSSDVEKLPNSEDIFDLDKLQEHVRISQDFKIQIRCRFLHSLQNLSQHQKLNPKSKEKQSSSMQKQRKWSVGSEEKQCETSTSTVTKLYTFYDPDLDFTFISSDNEIFGAKKQQKLNELSIDKRQSVASDSSDCEFELLVINFDQQFLEQNQRLFMGIKSMEQHYLV